jgi:tetratricopeptide (TPR) repeat protein
MREAMDARADAARKARDFHQLLVDKKYADAIQRWSEVKILDLSEVERAVFDEGVKRAREEIVNDAYASGLDAFRAQQWKRASSELKIALAYESAGPEAAKMRYYYGVSLHKQGAYADAAPQLEQAIAGGAERTVGADARFYLANALEMLRQLDRARAEYVKFADAHPMHPMHNTARRKVVELAKRLATTN